MEEEVEQYKMLHLKSVTSRVCNDLKTSEKHKEDLEMLYAGCQEELKNSIPISVIQNKIDELEHEKFKRTQLGVFLLKNFENQRLLAQLQVLQELLDLKE